MSRRRNVRSTPARAKYNGSDGGTSKSKQMRKALRFKRRPDLFATISRTLSQKGHAATSILNTGTQTFRVPPGVDKLTITMLGAGGGGGDNVLVRGGSSRDGGGGGAGGRLTFDIDVRPRQILTFNVGDGGGGGNGLNLGVTGENTTFTDPNTGFLYVAGGGFPGRNQLSNFGGGNHGGTGGGNTFSAGASVTINTEGLSGGLGHGDHPRGGTGASIGGLSSSGVIEGSGGAGVTAQGVSRGNTGSPGKVLIS